MTTRGRWFMRDRPLIGWLALAALVTTVHPFLPGARWLMVHLVVLGALTHAVMVWSIHFTDTLLRVDESLESRAAKTRRLTLLQVGVVFVLIGVPTTWWPLTVAGAVVVSAAVVWHVLALGRRLRAARNLRFLVTTHHYIAAALCLPVGATFGAILARGLDDEWHGRLLVAHTVVNLLGFVGLTVLGTLITLWATMLRTRMVEHGERHAARALPVSVCGIVLAVAGPLVDVKAVAVTGILVYAAGVALTGAAMWRVGRRRPPVTFPTLSAAAALAWLFVGVCWLAAKVLTQTWAEVGDGYGSLTPVFVVGFALQMLLGALTHLLPVVLGGGPSVLRAVMLKIERFGVFRWSVTNLGLALCLLPVPSVVRVIVSTLVLIALVAFIPLMFSGIRAGVAARRAIAAEGGVGARAAARRRGEQGDDESARVPTFSRLELLTGFGLVAAATSLGVGVDPAAAGLGRGTSGGAGASGVTPTGKTVRVAVTARGMRFSPDAVEVQAGDALVIDLHNADEHEVHDLVFANGATSGRLSPDGRGSVDVGVVGSDLDGWCSVIGHRQMGMTMVVRALGAAVAQDHATHAAPADDAPALDSMRSPAEDFVAHDAVLAPVPAGRVHRVTLTVREVELEVAPGVRQLRWTFNGTGVGPVLRGRVGDTFEVTLINEGSMGHSIDFHAGRRRPDEVMRTIPPGERLEYRFTEERAGIWLYHCSTSPMSVHIAAGMHGAVVIEPPDLPAADRNYVMVQSEVFLGPQGGPVAADKVVAERPDAVVFNGYAWQYTHRPLEAKVGELVRIWVLSAGPNRSCAFHVIGGQFHTVWTEGAYLLREGRGSLGGTAGGSQAMGLHVAQGGFVELRFNEPGHYPFVNHVMVDAERGAKGVLRVTE